MTSLFRLKLIPIPNSETEASLTLNMVPNILIQEKSKQGDHAHRDTHGNNGGLESLQSDIVVALKEVTLPNDRKYHVLTSP